MTEWLLWTPNSSSHFAERSLPHKCQEDSGKDPPNFKILLPSVALIEALLVLKSQGKEPIIIQAIFEYLEKIFRQEKLSVLPCTPREIAQAVQLDTLAEGNFFDALIASSALTQGKVACSDSIQ